MSKTELARDSLGTPVTDISVENWRPARKTVTAAAWVDLSDGKPRSAIYIKNESTVDDLIISPVDDDTITHDPGSSGGR